MDFEVTVFESQIPAKSVKENIQVYFMEKSQKIPNCFIWREKGKKKTLAGNCSFLLAPLFHRHFFTVPYFTFIKRAVTLYLVEFL